MTPPQESRTGGVAVLRYRGTGMWAYKEGRARYSNEEPGTWFPLAEAEALIDPNDPAVRVRIMQAIAQDERMYVPSNYVDALTDAVLAALRSKP